MRFGCEECWPETAAKAWEARSHLKKTESIINDTHLIVGLLGCGKCGQKFLSVMTETIDWVDGDDPQHWVSLPVMPDEAAHLINGEDGLNLALSALDHERRSLHHDAPKGSAATSYWANGIWISQHD
jgi:hypothetical protein